MRQTPYISSEDSTLLRKALSQYEGQVALEIGAGNAGGLEPLSRHFDYVIGTDLVRPDMHDWPRSGSDFVLADRASCFRENSFDLVAFNPPYIPSKFIEDIAVDAGINSEVPLGFFREALRVIRDNGRIVMVLEGERSEKRIREEGKKKGFVLRLVSAERNFFETLAIYESFKL
jgi:release factor glutamine methyltransferase